MTEVTHAAQPILPFTRSITDRLTPFMEPGLRVTTGLLLVPHGFAKLFTDGALVGTGQFFESVGLTPGYELALLVALVEFFGGIFLALGLLTRPVAILIVGFLAQATLFHAGNGFLWTEGGYEYPLFWAVAALVFVVKGGGRYSLDRLVGREF